ncbi:MAG: response regulator [Polyangiales bacterium]
MLHRVLVSHGYRVLEAPGPIEALELADRHAGPIDVLLTDVVMPHMNGRQLADRLGPLRPDMHVLLMSGYTADVVLNHGVANESTDFLAKPVTPAALLGMLRRIFDARSTTPPGFDGASEGRG